MKKYELTEEIRIESGVTLYRIKAAKTFGNVNKGDTGGFVEKESNLSQDGNAWVYGDACVYGDAQVYGNAQVSGDAWVCGNALVSGDARVYGNAQVSGDALVSGDADYIVFKNWWSSGRYFTWTRSNNMWRAGCFYGTGSDLVKKAYRDSEESGREYERIVNYVEQIKTTTEK